MNLQKILVPLGVIVLLGVAWQSYGWAGLAFAGGAVVMWGLLHVTRTMQVLRRAANRPIGYVDSAVMLNARLKPGMTLMHVVAMTRSLGELHSPKDEQPEVYRWTDASQSRVNCEFQGGRLARWELFRPPAPAEAPAPPAP